MALPRVIVVIGGWGIFIVAYLKAQALRTAMHQSGYLTSYEEDEWSYGQLIVVLLMSLAVLALAEAIKGTYHCKDCT